MLTMAHMGGMEEMNVFYEDCLEELYPPGVCGTYCNEHTYVRPSRKDCGRVCTSDLAQF